MAAGNIRGITVSISGDTSDLVSALKKSEGETKKVQSELKQVEKLLKFDPKNVELLAQKQKLLGDAVQSTEKKLDALKQAQSEVERKFQAGEIGEEAYRKFKREIIATEGQLKAFQNQLARTRDVDIDVELTGTEKVKGALKEIASEAKAVGKQIGSALSTGAAAGVAGVGALVVGSTDLNNDLARLRTNAQIAGRDLGVLENGLASIVAVTGEADSGVETLSNLLASGFSDNQMEAVIEGINGAAIKFSDTLKTEGIADGIQETFASGKSIGMFAELLERSGVDVEEFDKKLAKAKKSGEETNLLLETFADLGLSKTSEAYKDLNGDLVENNKATFEMQKAMADLAIVLTPLVTVVADFVTKLAEWASENTVLAKTFAIVSAVVLGLSTAIRVIVPIVQMAIKVFKILKNSFTVIRTALLLLSGPIGWVIAAITALIAIGVALYKNWNTIGPWLGKLWDGIKNMAVKVFTAIKDSIVRNWNFIKNTNSLVWNAVKNIVSKVVGSIKTFVVNAFNNIKTNVANATNRAKQAAITAFEGMRNGVSNKISSLIAKVKTIPGNIIKTFVGVNKQMFSIGKSIIEGILKGITSKLRALKDKAKEIADTVKTATKNALKINSPSKIMIPLGEGTVEGVEVGIEDRLKKLKTTAVKIADTTMNAASVLNSSSARNQQQKQVAQANIAAPQNLDLTSLVNAVVQLANNQPDVKLYMDGRQVATSIDRQQYNSANILALTKGVTLG